MKRSFNPLALLALGCILTACSTPEMESASTVPKVGVESPDRAKVREWLTGHQAAWKAGNEEQWKIFYDPEAKVLAYRGAKASPVSWEAMPKGHQGDTWIVDIIPQQGGLLDALCFVEWITYMGGESEPYVSSGYSIYRFRPTETGLKAVRITSMGGFKGVLARDSWKLDRP